jgi:hypothetical protein
LLLRYHHGDASFSKDCPGQARGELLEPARGSQKRQG